MLFIITRALSFSVYFIQIALFRQVISPRFAIKRRGNLRKNMKKYIIALSELKINESCIVNGLSFNKEKTVRLCELGLVKGTELKMIKRAPTGFPVAVFVRGYELCLGKTESDNIAVEVKN